MSMDHGLLNQKLKNCAESLFKVPHNLAHFTHCVLILLCMGNMAISLPLCFNVTLQRQHGHMFATVF